MKTGNFALTVFLGTAFVLAVPVLEIQAGEGKQQVSTVQAVKEKLKEKAEKKAEKEKNKDLLAGNMGLLNQWGEQTAAVQGLYAAAFKVLSAISNATYADLAGDAEVQRLCAENGIVHLGGPMLGCIAPDGVKVWLRTLRPAKVEVRLSVDGTEKSYGPVNGVIR